MNFFAQTSVEPNVITKTTVTTTPDTTMLGPIIAISWLVLLFLIICYVKIFTKAGRKWWEAIIPIYNSYVLLKIVGRPGWWLLLFFIPFVSLIVLIVVMLDLAKVFGKGVGTALGLIFLPFIFVPVLAFGKAKYTGASPASSTAKSEPSSANASSEGLNAQAVSSIPTAGTAVGAGVGAAQPGAPITEAPLAEQHSSAPQGPNDVTPAPQTEPAARPVEETPADAPSTQPSQEPTTPETPSQETTTPESVTPTPDAVPTDPVTPPSETPTSPEDQPPTNLVQ